MPRKKASPRKKSKLSGEDMREGLTCVLSVKVPDPKFSSQTKDKLVSSEVRPVVEGRLRAFQHMAGRKPGGGKIIVGKIVEAALRVRLRARPAN
jgi:DNA gyrase subunit B